ncbi:MAG: enoyl-CoA hydratase/isomerase family protein [Oceanococcus sp.]
MTTVLTNRNGAVATVSWNRPDAMNALTPEMLKLAGDQVRALAQDAEVKVIVLTGEGKAFSAGVDLKALGTVELINGSVGEILDAPARRLIDAIEQAPQPVIAKVNGHCYTGALEIALACDLLLCADEAGFGDTHAKWGLRPSWGMSQRLPQRVGSQRARELSYSARTVKGVEAAVIGLACQSLPRAQLDERVDQLCEQISSNSAQALAAYKELYRRTQGSGLDEGLAFEFSRVYPMTDSDERLAGFLQR